MSRASDGDGPCGRAAQPTNHTLRLHKRRMGLFSQGTACEGPGTQGALSGSFIRAGGALFGVELPADFQRLGAGDGIEENAGKA
jgi:hypothetical protein